MRIPVNGVQLNVERWGNGPPLILLHGFTGSADTWAPFAHSLGRRFELIAVDLLGHGASDSPADPNRYTMHHTVDDLLALLDRLELEQVDLLGYSMGGRIALHLALAAPQRIAALVLESTGPGIADATERAERQCSDAELATMIEREGVEAFINRWERQPLFATQTSLPSELRARLRAQRLLSNPIGLANSLRGAGAGAHDPLHARLADLHQPTLLIAGDLDPKYTEIARLMAESLPSAKLDIVTHAGHAVHLEQPATFTQSVLQFMTLHRRSAVASVPANARPPTTFLTRNSADRPKEHRRTRHTHH